MKKPISFNEMPEVLETILAMQVQILNATKPKPTDSACESVKELLLTKEACELLSITRTTLYNWERKGIVKSFGVEGKKFFKRSQILEILIPLN